MKKVGLGLVLLALVGCGVDFDHPNEVRSLRVLGVKKSAPYAKPGEEVELSMLLADGSEKPAPDIETRWFGGCFNPPGDIFYGCFPHVTVGAALALGDFGSGGGLPELPAAGDVDPKALKGFDFHIEEISSGTGSRFVAKMPENVITRRDPPIDERTPHYGIGYVFFTACAGELRLKEDFADFGGTELDITRLPFTCHSKKDGSELGQNDFVVGYTAIYVYDRLRNRNPSIKKFTIDGKPVDAECIDDTCLDEDVPATADSKAEKCKGLRCVDACDEDGDVECPEKKVAVIVDKTVVDEDGVTKAVEGTSIQEQMWVDYYVDRGEVSSDVRLVNDATTGFNEETETGYRASKAKGPVHLWAVVHDNRGGTAWARLGMVVK